MSTSTLEVSPQTSDACEFLESLSDSALIRLLSNVKNESESRALETLVDLLVYQSPKQKLEGSLYEFVCAAWPVVEPSQPFAPGWHIRAICEHLEELSKPDAPLFTDLLVNIPPGHMKSLLICVFWPCWKWTTDPSSRWLFASYSGDFATRDSLKRRNIIRSEWYQSMWPVKLVGDQDAKTRYDNSVAGWMFTTSVTGAGTGEHPDYIVIDDPHKGEEAVSKAARDRVESWWSNTIASRGLMRDVRRVVVMQRLHREDLSGIILRQGGWVHLCLPLDFRPGAMPTTPLGWQDPRTKPDELLWDKVSPAALERLRRMSPYDQMGQLQQKPAGQDSKAEWPASYFDGAELWFEDFPEDLSIRVAYLDPSLGRTETSDFAAIVSLGIDTEGIIWVDAEIERSDTTVIADRCVRNGREWLPQAFGIEVNGFQQLLCQPILDASMKAGFQLPIWEINNSENKQLRIRRLSPFLRQGTIRFRDTPGCRMLVEQLREFPHGKHDDGPDALEGAVRVVQAVWGGVQTDAVIEEVGI